MVRAYRASSESEPLLLDTVRLTRGDQRPGVTDAVYAGDLATHFVELLRQEATAQAATGGGQYQRGALMAYRGDSEEAEAAFPFAERGETPLRGGEDGLSSGTEGPSERGVTSMVQRHADSVMRLHLLSYEATHGMMAKMLADETRRRERAEQRADESEILRQTMLDHEQQRALIARKEERRERFVEEAFSTVKEYLPRVLDGLPQSNRRAVVGGAVIDFLRGVGPGQAAAIAESLPPETRVALGRVLALAASVAEAEDAPAPKGTH
jgi:hypothetical protein